MAQSIFFYSGDCSIVRLPYSIPSQPLNEIIEQIDYDLSTKLIESKLYPFANEGNDNGPLVFDGRELKPNNEFPIRFYDIDYIDEKHGLSEIIFSSFMKMLECLTHYLKESTSRKTYEIIPDFFHIDPDGAGKTGIDYWLTWIKMDRENLEHFGE